MKTQLENVGRWNCLILPESITKHKVIKNGKRKRLKNRIAMKEV